MEVLKYVRLPLIPAEIIILKIEPSSKHTILIILHLLLNSDLIDVRDLYKATAFQAAPDCFKEEKSDKFKHRNGSEVPWAWSKDLKGHHIILSNNHKTAAGCHFDWEKIVGNVIWRSGTHAFEI